MVSPLAKEAAITTIEDFSDHITAINRCLAYTIRRLSDHFQEMCEKHALEHNRKLHEAQRLAALGKMADRAVHELRNPLIVAGGFSGRLYEIMPDDDPHKKYLARVIETVLVLEVHVSKIIKLKDEDKG